MRNKVMTMLNEHKDQLTLAPELIIDELMKKYEINNALSDVEACHPEHLWDRYGLPYILPMTTKVFARD